VTEPVEVKICGVCRPSDAAAAAAAGATWIGVILAPGRARTRTETEAKAIFEAAGAARVGDAGSVAGDRGAVGAPGAAGAPDAGVAGGACRAGVFVDADAATVLRAVERLELDVVQLHGAEPPSLVEAIRAASGVEVWKAVRVRTPGDVEHAGVVYHQADGLLLDGWSEHGHGGVGARFDWAATAAARRKLHGRARVIAAGGLRPDNVAEAIRLLRPDAVDVSSGVEERIGRKSVEQVHAFIAAVRGAKDPQ
jgi:phosphoribosylanthranilate isomerase